MGAGGDGAAAERLHARDEYGVPAMDVYGFFLNGLHGTAPRRPSGCRRHRAALGPSRR
jgi:hypothetical protein